MWLEVILTKTDLQTVLQQFSPLTLHLGDNGSLLLAEPTDVFIIPDEGIGVVCDATLHWPFLGFDVPVALRGLTVRVLPSVEKEAAGSPLAFRLQMDHAGVAVLPAMIDHRVTQMVNDELQKKNVELSWAFLETLTHKFDLPPAIASAAAISLIATAGMVKANSHALGLAVHFETKVDSRTAPGTSSATADGTVDPAVAAAAAIAPSAAASPPAASTSNGAQATTSRALPDAFDARSFIVGGAVATMAMTTIGGLARLFRRRSW